MQLVQAALLWFEEANIRHTAVTPLGTAWRSYLYLHDCESFHAVVLAGSPLQITEVYVRLLLVGNLQNPISMPPVMDERALGQVCSSKA